MTYGLLRLKVYQQLHIADQAPRFQGREAMCRRKRWTMDTGRQVHRMEVQAIWGWGGGRDPVLCNFYLCICQTDVVGMVGRFLQRGTMMTREGALADWALATHQPG